MYVIRRLSEMCEMCEMCVCTVGLCLQVWKRCSTNLNHTAKAMKQ